MWLCRTQTGRHGGHIQAVRTTRSPYAVHAHDRPLASLNATDNTIHVPTGQDRAHWLPSEAEGGHASLVAPAIRLESRPRAEAHRARFTGKAGQSSKKARMQRPFSTPGGTTLYYAHSPTPEKREEAGLKTRRQGGNRKRRFDAKKKHTS